MLDEATEATLTAGTAFVELAESAPAPVEPAWMQDAATASVADEPPYRPPDPKVRAATKAARAAEIVKALNPEQARAVTTPGSWRTGSRTWSASRTSRHGESSP